MKRYILSLLALSLTTSCSLTRSFEECSADTDCARFEKPGALLTCGEHNTCEELGAECRSDTDCGVGESCSAGVCSAPVPPDMRAVNSPGDMQPHARDMKQRADMRDITETPTPAEEDMSAHMSAEDMRVDAPDMRIEPQPTFPGDPPGWRPLEILFIGNSFTHQGPVPQRVQELAASANWPSPVVHDVTPGGRDLTFHKTNPDTLAAVDRGGWDVVVLQDFSTRPTDQLGAPTAFKQDVTWFYDRVQATSPGATVVLYMTWARHPDHSFYPDTFADPAQMQRELRFHYNDAANQYIPTNSTAADKDNVVVAPVGDAWETHFNAHSPLRLHDSDDYHANEQGQYLNGLVIYATIYNRSTQHLTRGTLDYGAASALQQAADTATRKTIKGGPNGMTLPGPKTLEVGRRLLVDAGLATRTSPSPWNNLGSQDAVVSNLIDTTGEVTSTSLHITDDFEYENADGLDNNGFGYPAEASNDTLWVGSFDGHQQALLERAEITISGLDPRGRYTLTMFAARTGDDGGHGRLTRYTIGAATADLDASNNTTSNAMLSNVQPSAMGELELEITPSPAGGSRFGYLGVLELERTQ